VLRPKKSAERENAQWCVILSPIESELHKAETVEKIVEIFPLSIEEASQLVERTPIILLENLSYDTAKRIKDLFANIQADILLTDDAFQRRKCYRTVWPQDPMPKLEAAYKDLLRRRQAPRQEEPPVQEELSKETAIRTIRSNDESKNLLKAIAEYKTTIQEQSKSLVAERQQTEKLLQDMEQLKKEIFDIKRSETLKDSERDEFQYLSLELEKAKELLQEKAAKSYRSSNRPQSLRHAPRGSRRLRVPRTRRKK